MGASPIFFFRIKKKGSPARIFKQKLLRKKSRRVSRERSSASWPTDVCTLNFALEYGLLVANLVKNDPCRHRWSMYDNGSSNYDKGSGMYDNGSANYGNGSGMYDNGSANYGNLSLCMVTVPPTVVRVPL